MGKTKAGKGMKLEVVVEASGLPLGLEVAAANISEQELMLPAVDDVPVEVPPGTPVIADKPSRNDGRRLRRYRHRWLMERTNAWLHCYRGLAMRWAYYTFMYVGLAYLSFIHMALQRL